MQIISCAIKHCVEINVLLNAHRWIGEALCKWKALCVVKSLLFGECMVRTQKSI